MSTITVGLGGTYQDHYKNMFSDVLLLQAQQKGSVLKQTVLHEGMMGDKTYFDKLGSVTSYQKTSRNQLKNAQDITFERRQVTEQLQSFDHIFDKEDLIKYINNPRNEVVMSATMQFGRFEDQVIWQAITGTAYVTTTAAGVTTINSETPTLSVAVDDHSYDTQLGAETGSGHTGLTPSKIKKGLAVLGENYGYNGTERVFCVAPLRQIMNLSAFIQTTNALYASKTPLDGPGIVKNLDGWMGVTFIAYEGTGLDSNGDVLAALYTEDAVKMGTYIPLTVDVIPDNSKVANPDCLSVWEAIGASRMYKEKVCLISCAAI